MKKLLSIIFIFFAANALATDYYVRPSGGSYGSEDGTSYANAWDGFSSVNWSTVDSGNGTLWVCGAHSETITVAASGENGVPIIIDGDCSTQGGTDGSIDGGGSRNNNVNTAGFDYLTIRNLSMSSPYDDHILGDGSSNLIVEYNSMLSDNDGDDPRGLRCQTCVDLIFRYNDYEATAAITGGTQTDGVFIQYGSNQQIIGNKFVIRSSSTGHNDCVQYNDIDSGTVTIAHNYCFQDNTRTSLVGGIYGTFSSADFNIYGNVFRSDYGEQLIVSRYNETGMTFNINNNTIIGGSSNSDRLVWLHADTGNSITVNFFNNIVSSTDTDLVQMIDIAAGGTVTLNADYNLYYCPNKAATCWDGGSWASWTGSGYDTNSPTPQDPSLNANHQSDDSNDPAVGAGDNSLGATYDDGLDIDMTIATWISAFATGDRDTVGGVTWDIGAFEWSTAPPASTGTMGTGSNSIGTGSSTIGQP
jgi:hypothetical protein